MAATQPKPTRGQNYGNIARTRLAFDNRSDRSVPLFFEWVIENKIAGMAFPASKEQIVSLKELHGVGLVCSCIETEAAPPESLFDEIEGLDSIHIEWKDMGVPRKDLIDNLLAKMHEYVSTGRPAVVHCFAGKGRTGTALALYLVKYECMGALEAIKLVRDRRPGSIETTAQEEWIVDYYNRLHPDQKQSLSNQEYDHPFLKVKLKKVAKQ